MSQSELGHTLSQIKLMQSLPLDNSTAMDSSALVGDDPPDPDDVYNIYDEYEYVDFSDLDGDEQFAFVCYAIYAVICGITFVVLVIIMVNVIRKVGATDKIIPLMLAMLQLSAISKFSY